MKKDTLCSKEPICQFYKFSMNQGCFRAIYVFSLILLEKLLKRKLLKHCYIRFTCFHGYRFIARCDDWWRFFGHFEPKTTAFIESMISSNDIVFDIGAHIGIHTIHFAKKAKLVVAIEPEPLNYTLLCKNLKLNQVKNVIPIQIAISNYDGYTELFIAEDSGRHTISPSFVSQNSKIKYENKIKIKCKRLDTLFNPSILIGLM